MSITSSCMVVNLQIGVWKGYRLDKEASREVTKQNGAHIDAARVNKHLISKEALAPVESAAGAVRNHFYTHTLPWKDNGDRVLTRKRFTDFISSHEALVAKFDEAADTLVNDTYPQELGKAEFRMGELWKPSDYPRPEELRRRFYVNLDIDAVTTANDFRVALDEDAAAIVKNGMESAMEQRLNRAMQDVWGRLSEVVQHFHDRMAEDGARFWDTTVTKIADLVQLLPDLNLTDDPELERIRREVEQHLSTLSPSELRKDPAMRSAAADEARRIMDDMRGFMAAFGGDAS